MRIVMLLVGLGVAGCGKPGAKASGKPRSHQVDLSYKESVSEIAVRLSLFGESGSAVVADGVFELKLSGELDDKGAGPLVCSGKADVPASAFAGGAAEFVVHLSACPANPEAAAKWVQSSFTPRGGTSIASLPALEQNLPFANLTHDAAPDPAIARRAERQSKLLAACKAGGDPGSAEGKAGRAAAAVIRDQARPEIEKRMPGLPAPVQHGLAAMLANPDACNYILGVFVRWKFSPGADWDKELGGERIAFGQLVERAHWPPALELATALAKQLEVLGDGWLFASAGHDGTAYPGAKIVVDLEVASSEQIALGEAYTFPRLEVHTRARVAIPPGFDEAVDLPTVKFEASGQKVEYTRRQGDGDTTAAGRVVDTMVTQLAPRLPLATLAGQ